MFDPLSAEDMVRAILEGLRNPLLRSSLVTRGLKRVQDFSFHRAAKEMLPLYQQILTSDRQLGESTGTRWTCEKVLLCQADSCRGLGTQAFSGAV